MNRSMRLVPRRGKSTPPASTSRVRHVLGPAAAFLIVALISTLVYGAYQGRERHEKREEFVLQAQQLAFSVESQFRLPLELLASVTGLFLSSDDVSREEFATFVRPIVERHPSIYAFEWMPLVTDEEREGFVRMVRAQGWPEFRIQQKSPAGELILAARRPDYLPILYMEPLEPVVLGLDVIGNPERGDESFRARATESSSASDRYSLIEDPDDVFSVIAYEPVLRDGQFVGLIGVLLRLEPVVRAAISGGGTEGIYVELRDESAPPEKRRLFATSSDATGLDSSATWTRKFEFAKRNYAVSLTPLPDSFWKVGYGPVLLWGAGMLLATLAAFGTASITQIGHLRRRVDEATELGQYRLGRLLGEGGMGVVYRAEHRMLARPAAIKLIRPPGTAARDRTRQQRLLRQFEREAKATAALHSPHTIQVYDFGTTERGEFYYVMELLDGLDLETLVGRMGPLRPERAIFILQQACHSLAEAHEAGLVHRDVKPANLYLCRHGLEYDFVKVLDFGLVRDGGGASGGSTDESLRDVAGSFVGTPAYSPPEMIESDSEIDGRADIYSLGCVAYWLLTGRHVFVGETPLAVILAHLSDAPICPSKASELQVPPDLAATVMACLEKDPGRRPQTAEELAARLGECRLSTSWSSARAREWWEIHNPTGGQMESRESQKTILLGESHSS